MRNKGHIAVLLALVFSATSPVLGVAATYTFTDVADTTDGFLDFNPPTINDSGTLSFRATFSGGSGVFKGSGGPITTIADTAGPYSIFHVSPSINSAGVVAFQAALDAGGTGIFTGSGGLVTTIADSTGPLGGMLTPPTINSSGTVVFEAFIDAGGQGVFTGSGGSPTTIADTGGTFATFAAPTINSSGLVVAPATLDTAGVQGLYSGTVGLSLLADNSGSLESLTVPGVNSSGTVAFRGFYTVGDGIFTTSGGPITTVTDFTGPYSLFSAPSINDAGMLAFYAELDATGHGIFTGPDPILDAVIKKGDSLFGATVTSLSAFRNALNNSGQIGFLYILDDGRRGVAVATPETTSAAVPEPATLAAWLLTSLAAMIFARRRR